MALAPVPSDEAIIEAFKAGQLVSELKTYHESDEDNENQFASKCVKLHNEHKIDLFAVAKSDAFSLLSQSDFFTAQHVFVVAIPDMSGDHRSIMQLGELLIQKAGADLAANRPNASIRSWFVNNQDEASLVVVEALNGDNLATKFMTFALQAGNMIAETLEIAAKFSDDRRLSAITALGGMEYSDRSIAISTIDSLLSYLEASQSDLTRANALQALINIAAPISDPLIISTIIKAAVAEPGDQTLHTLSRVLWFNSKNLESEDRAAALNALKSVNPEHTGTLDGLDQALSQMLSGPDERLALNFIRDFFSTHDLSIEQFDSVEHKLRGGNRERLFRLVIEWLLTGKRSLCENLSRLIIEDDALPNAFSDSDKKLQAKELIFVFRKALGFLFIKPVTCCSILVWALRSGIEEVQSAARAHLFDIILVSYGGESNDYLKTIAVDDPAYPLVTEALGKQSDYHDKLQSSDSIKELQPSEFQRAITSKKSYDEMNEAQKKAQKKSIFHNLVTRQVILYGHRTRSHVYDADGKHKSIDMEMHSYSASFEIPRRDMLDPVGLGYILAVFRVEQFR